MASFFEFLKAVDNNSLRKEELSNKKGNVISFKNFEDETLNIITVYNPYKRTLKYKNKELDITNFTYMTMYDAVQVLKEFNPDSKVNINDINT